MGVRSHSAVAACAQRAAAAYGPMRVLRSCVMRPATYHLQLPAALLERGFWIYVCAIDSPRGELLYVGVTGDSSSTNAQSPFNRFGRHLDTNKANNQVRTHLRKRGLSPEAVRSFELVAHGPLFAEARDDLPLHRERRDVLAGLERALTEELREKGYTVLNKVSATATPDRERWAQVRAAFAQRFPSLDAAPAPGETRPRLPAP